MVEKDIGWHEIRFRRLRNKLFRGTITEKEKEQFHESRKKLGISWDGEK